MSTNFKGKITKTAQEAALQMVNYSSSVLQQQLQQQTLSNGVMKVEQVNSDAAGNTLITVSDDLGNLQTVTYTGFDYPYPGQFLLVSNGLAQ